MFRFEPRLTDAYFASPREWEGGTLQCIADTQSIKLFSWLLAQAVAQAHRILEDSLRKKYEQALV
uniref:Uncharacterized protein n=1 Tax=Rhizophora mucronata TaxID=61149 RepID=A0A2P2NBD2_RHIMU